MAYKIMRRCRHCPGSTLRSRSVHDRRPPDAQIRALRSGWTLEQANRIAGGVTNDADRPPYACGPQGETSRRARVSCCPIKNDPRVREALFGGSTIGSLPTTGGPPGGPPAAAPLTQQSLMPGQPPGAPTVVPGGQDLSQFATQGAPTPTLATIGPQGGMPDGRHSHHRTRSWRWQARPTGGDDAPAADAGAAGPAVEDGGATPGYGRQDRRRRGAGTHWCA